MTRFKRTCCLVMLVVAICAALGITAFANVLPEKEIFNPDAVIETSEKSIQVLNSYEDAVNARNASISNETIRDVITTITFSDYLTFDQFAEYISRHDIEVVQLQLRGLNEEGKRLTIFTRTDAGLEKTEQLLNEQAASAGFDIVGITGMYALVSSDNLQDVVEDDLTYLADTTGDSYSVQNNNIEGATRNNLTTVSRIDLFPQSLTWDLEDLGILK